MTEFKTLLCECGMTHQSVDTEIAVGRGVLVHLSKTVMRFGKHPFLLADENTYRAAGEQVRKLLFESGLTVSEHVFFKRALLPDESAVAQAVMHFDADADVIVAVGSGVISDIGKLLSKVSGKPLVTVATAPSMDGYASATSSMEEDGVKVSIPSMPPVAIYADTDILAACPRELLLSGLSDMLAKYISIAEWRIANLIVGEHYCERVAGVIRKALAECVENAEGLLSGDSCAIEAVFWGLIKAGLAMRYARSSRPASGVEHYFSHIFDMRGLAFGTPVAPHGIQCASATLLAVEMYEKLLGLTLSRERALKSVTAFDVTAYQERLRAFLGKGAETMIALEAREGKYSKEKHAERLDRILENWERIKEIVKEEIPPLDTLGSFYQKMGIPEHPTSFGIDKKTLPMTFEATRDIRDKYTLSRLAFDLGVTDELAKLL